MSQSDGLLEAVDIRKRFGGITALDTVSLSVGAG
jgi:ABC-type sugar transport system ATPase subunit